jgi:hypothetical protein
VLEVCEEGERGDVGGESEGEMEVGRKGLKEKGERRV